MRRSRPRASLRLLSTRGHPACGRVPVGPGGGADGCPAAGFTLLEVLVALVILGVALTALLSAQGGAIRLRTQAEELTRATFLLESRMAEIRLADEFPDLGTQTGDFGDAYPGYRWESTVAEAPFPFTREVRVAVTWPGGRREERLELLHYVFDRKARP